MRAERGEERVAVLMALNCLCQLTLCPANINTGHVQIQSAFLRDASRGDTRKVAAELPSHKANSVDWSNRG